MAEMTHTKMKVERSEKTGISMIEKTCTISYLLPFDVILLSKSKNKNHHKL